MYRRSYDQSTNHRHDPRRWRRKAGLLAMAGALFGATLVATPATALPQSGLEGRGAVVSDEQLSTVRGKFIQPGNVLFFGISLLTSWQDSAGVTTLARVSFNVDFLNPGEDGKPAVQLLLSWDRSGDPLMDVTETNDGYTTVAVVSPEPIGGIDTGAGAAQLNVIAGADNSARNSLQIALVPVSSLTGDEALPMESLAVPEPVTFADGDTLEYRLGDNQLVLAMTGNGGMDSSLQSIGGGDVGRMLQQTVLHSDGNSVRNAATITFGTDQLGFDAQAVRLTEALSAMHGHGY